MISTPVDYGLTPEQTLAHHIEPCLPEGFGEEFDAHWQTFRDAVATVPTRWQGNIDSTFNQVIVRSLDSVRIAARVAMPPEGREIHGIVVTSHGYAGVGDDFGDAPEPWTERGMAVVRVRVRGYPPSTLDTPDLRSDWILHRPPHVAGSAGAWIVRGAIADIMQAASCARSHFGESLPIVIHGESLGGGLAVMAAAQMTQIQQAPTRLILELPSFGDWRWRAFKYCNGAGGRINMLLDALRGEQRENLLRGLLLYDAALHASNISSPALAKLATLDDVVPAPAAASIFNAIASAKRYRFVTRFGHFDGGITDARRHVRFERLAMDFADTSMSALEAIVACAVPLDLPAAKRESG